MECEICGATGASKVTRLEGAELVACESCSSLGEAKQDLSERKQQRSRTPDTDLLENNKASGLDFKPGKLLRRNYGRLVREAREDQELTMEELAEEISEKESVVRRVENEELRPAEELSQKLERELEVELFRNREEEPVKKSTQGNESLTIGDVARVK
ncbi:MAG: multiprotein bridging factor aMBF1 [Candidatus Aenigmatarchaeota archaeon]